ncbi:hypothetical protein JKF63_00505 [Porcisia hertigi]|uniref:REH2 DRSM domain-containing protein n=1 Tax=Porcisia hertigi TaxID=2761500 RepID=A0A836L144_9TRYP|nr:hypothetical protein JKF63_00505 [Porcisia hertigi]
MPLCFCAVVRCRHVSVIARRTAPPKSSTPPPLETRRLPLRCGCSHAYRSAATLSFRRVLIRQMTVSRLVYLPTVALGVVNLQRRFQWSLSSQPPLHIPSAAAARDEGNTDDWSSVEVEVLMPEPKVTSSSKSSSTSTAEAAADAGHASPASQTNSSTAATSVETIDTIDSYAKAKVSNFVRRLLQPSTTAGAAGTTSSSALGLEVRQVQGCGKGAQYHARWRLPLPAEFGERYGEGFAPTAKEAEAVAAMHAERVIDTLGFQLFQLSSKQRKHAEAARAAGRWAPMPAVTATPASSSDATITAAEVVPPPDTPSPPPLQLLELSAQQRQEKDLRINGAKFVPVQRSGFTPLAFTLASPHHLDSSSHARIERFFRVHRTSLKANLRLVLLKGEGHDAIKASNDGHGVKMHQHSTKPGDLFLAQLLLPLPARFGKRVAMGKAPIRKEAVLLACMHAELIIDAVGFALYPDNRENQAAHAAECAKMHRWCAQPGDCAYRYATPSPPPMELVEELHQSRVSPATVVFSEASGGVENAFPHSGVLDSAAGTHGAGRGSSSSFPSSRIAEACTRTASPSVESILLQHQQAMQAVSIFTDEPSLRDYESARVLLERYVEQFMQPPAPQTTSTTHAPNAASRDSFLMELMFVEELGQRDRRVFRATITVPLCVSRTEATAVVAAEAAADAVPHFDTASPLPYTQSFVAIGVSYTNHLAEVAAAVHALRTLAALNRLCLVRGSVSMVQALESFAMRAQIPLYDAAKPLLYPSQLPPGSLPAPVRVMEGFVGRIAASGLNLRSRRYLPKDVDTEEARGRFATRVPLLSEETGRAVTTLNREDDLLRELRASQERLPRMQWDTSPDAEGRIIVSPDQDVQKSRMYNHTLSSVRQPDSMATTRLRDYLERHGKSPEMALSVVRVCGKPESAEEGALYVAKVLLPVTLRRGPKAKRRQFSGLEGQSGALSSSAPHLAEPPQPEQPPTVGYVAQGEGPTRDDAVLLCAAHAEVLLDAAGEPFYDHSLLQRKHADTARALGRWAPLVRGAALPPESLRRIPPPLRKVARGSVVWARVQEQQCASACNAVTGESAGYGAVTSPVGLKSGECASATVHPSAAGVDDEVLCDIAALQFVYHTDIGQGVLRRVAGYFSSQGSDIYRTVRQYTVRHPELGTIHRAIVEMPLPASYGRRYAVGCGSAKRQALFLCCKHALLILDALRIPVFNQPGKQKRYARAAAVQGRDAPFSNQVPGRSDTPSPPGLYYLTTCAAAKKKPPEIPKLPRCSDRRIPAFWGAFVRDCASYVTRHRETRVKEAVSAPEGPRVPCSNLVAEDTAAEMARDIPSDKFTRRQLLDLCRIAGLPDSTNEVPWESVALSPTERRFFTFQGLSGTPYTMRGVSDTVPAESRYRAFGHGVQLLLLVVRPNSVTTPTPRRTWWDGPRRTLCIHDCMRDQITPHGCLWVLRMWAAMHYPPLRVRTFIQKVEMPTEEPGIVHVHPHGEAVSPTPQPTPGSSPPWTSCPSATYQGVASIAESREGLEKVLFHASCETAGPAATTGATASVHGALRQLLREVQRAPTMQRLYRFLSQQPQLHIPSLRLLTDPEDVVHHLHAQVCDSHAGARMAQPAATLQAGNSAALLAFLAGDRQPSAPSPPTWCVEVLQKWVVAFSGPQALLPAAQSGETDSGCLQHRRLPSTLESTFVRYGLVCSAPSATKALLTRGVSSGQDLPAAPTPLAGALAILCQCLPEIPGLLSDEEYGKSTAGTQLVSHTTKWAERGRELPLQLAHLILMGLLLGCTPWAVRAVAMVACAEDTLEWYDQQSLRSAVAANNDGYAEVPQPPASRLAPYHSVDVTDAVLVSLDATAPPLPDAVLRFASKVEQRLEAVWMEVSVAAAAGKASPLPWLQSPETWGACLGVAGANKSSVPGTGALTLTERRTLRPLLQCAVATSAALHAVWVRATYVERGGEVDELDGGDNDGSFDERGAVAKCLIFQHRQSARYAAVRVGTGDTNDGKAVASARDFLAMATCFATFGCVVYPTEGLVASTLEQEQASVLLSPSREPGVSNGIDQARDDDAEDATDVANDDEEAEKDGVKLVDIDDEDGLDVGQFVRVLGTCVSPLAAVLVPVTPTRSASLQSHRATSIASDDMPSSGALRAVGENLPMLMLAFQETVPLLVHRHSSVEELTRLSAHLRSRVETTTPFSPQERCAISHLFTLAVRSAADGHIRSADAV